jgi:hypothetical protein
MQIKKKYILSIHAIWNGLSLKTISRYCPFKLFLSPLIRIVAGSDTSTSRGADQLVAQHSAIKMLASRTVFT